MTPSPQAIAVFYLTFSSCFPFSWSIPQLIARGIFLLTLVFKTLGHSLSLTYCNLYYFMWQTAIYMIWIFASLSILTLAVYLWFFPAVVLLDCFISLWLCSWFQFCQGIPLPLSSALWTLHSFNSQRVIFKIYACFLPFPQRAFTQPCGLTVPYKNFSKAPLTL